MYLCTMSKMDQIQAPVAADMVKFQGHFKRAMQTEVPLLDRVTRYIIRRKGKQMRPMFIFLSAKICGDVNELTYHAANLVELLHTATFITNPDVHGAEVIAEEHWQCWMTPEHPD